MEKKDEILGGLNTKKKAKKKPGNRPNITNRGFKN